MPIRPIDDKDWPAVLDLYFRGLADELAFLNRILPGKTVNFAARPDLERLLRSVCDDGTGQVFLAEEDGELAGYALITRKDYLAESPSEVGCVNGVYVADKFRRRGLGKLLYDAGVAWLKTHGIQFVELYHMANDPRAEAFWASLGFVTVADQSHGEDLNSHFIRKLKN